MADGERKSSDDLIRDANRRLRETPADLNEPGGSSPEGSEHEKMSTRPDPDELPALAESAEPAPAPARTPARVGSAVTATVVRFGLALLVFGGWFLFTRLDDASRDETGQIASTGDLDVMAMRVGDCFDDPEGDQDLVVDVAALPCSDPHDNEVFAVQSLAAAFPGDGFPGEDALWSYSYEVCSGAAFDSYVGRPYLDSALEVFSFTPSEKSWSDGDREFVCALYRLDLEKLTGTARDSGL